MHIGNSNISNFFIAISDNKIIMVKSGLEDFVNEMKKIEDGIKNRNHFSSHFLKNDIYHYQNPITGVKYIFQKIVNDKSKPKEG